MGRLFSLDGRLLRGDGAVGGHGELHGQRHSHHGLAVLRGGETMKKELSYMDSVHKYGRIWNLGMPEDAPVTTAIFIDIPPCPLCLSL